MIRRFLRSVILSIVVLSATTTLAFNDMGHRLVARIAWSQMEPAERQKVVDILQNHPHFDSYLAANRPADIPLDEWVFLQAATWSDSIRVPKGFHGNLKTHPRFKFHRGAWHFINYPYRAGEMPTSVPEPLPTATNLLEQLDLSQKVVRGTMMNDPAIALNVTPAQNQAVRLCWIMHLVGDIHQPLHATALIDPELFEKAPHSDEGGNFIAIRTDTDPVPVKLHSFWDHALGTTSDFASVRDEADRLTHDPGFAPSLLTELTEHPDPKQWAAESYFAAVSTAYLNGNLEFSLSDDVEKHIVTADQVPILKPEAQAAAIKLLRRRATLGGYRLATALKGALPN